MPSVCDRMLCCCLNPRTFQSGAGQSCLDICVHVLGVVTAAAVIVAAYYEGLNFSTAFAWHVVCMALAMPLFMVAGRWAYKSDPLCFTNNDEMPAKGKNAWKGWVDEDGRKGDGVEAEQTKWTRRNLHGNLMSIACLCMVAGYACIFEAHWSTKNYFGYEFSTGEWQSYQRIVHAWAGYVVILLVLQQVAVGFMKYAGLANGVKICTCHGVLGRLTVGLGCVNVILGMIAIGWDTWIIVIIGIAAFVMAWFAGVYPFPSREFYLGQPAPFIEDKAPDYGGVVINSA
eukprot:NODE_14676_length_1093_cov_8.437888.p1 GENE.NODE_14676_length_1093_cov_8.437888~~NODE_14676_length_1093_cov_8.437888.p1  ORF type:complete len:322 (+),score=42.39 NODE_14676_length_1093_cov_8.437888:109-966(+)